MGRTASSPDSGFTMAIVTGSERQATILDAVARASGLPVDSGWLELIGASSLDKRALQRFLWSTRCGYSTMTSSSNHGCESGGIGRRIKLRIWRRNSWGFKFLLSHPTFTSNFSIRMIQKGILQNETCHHHWNRPHPPRSCGIRAGRIFIHPREEGCRHGACANQPSTNQNRTHSPGLERDGTYRGNRFGGHWCT